MEMYTFSQPDINHKSDTLKSNIVVYLLALSCLKLNFENADKQENLFSHLISNKFTSTGIPIRDLVTKIF